MNFDVVDRQTGEILDKTLALNLIIRDKNDNPPVFKPEILNIDIPENTKEGENHTLMFVKQIGSTLLSRKQRISLSERIPL